MKVRFYAIPDHETGSITIQTEHSDILGNFHRSMTIEIMRTKEDSVQSALKALGWTPPGEPPIDEQAPPARISPRDLRITAANTVSKGTTADIAFLRAADYVAYLEHYVANLRANLNDLRANQAGFIARIDAEQEAQRQANAEILTLANGDRLHQDASTNAFLVQHHLDDLKRRLNKFLCPTEPNQAAVETALELADHPQSDGARYIIGSKMRPHIQDGEDYDATALRILAAEVRHLRASIKAAETRAKAQTTRANNAHGEINSLRDYIRLRDDAVESLKKEVAHARHLLEIAGLRLCMAHRPKQFGDTASANLKDLANTELAEPANRFLKRHNSPAAEFIRTFWDKAETDQPDTAP